MPLPTDPRGRALAQLVSVAMYERGLSARAERVLASAFREVAAALVTEGGDVTLRDRRRLAQLYQRFAALLGRGYTEASALTLRELTGYAELQAEVAAADLRALIGSAREAGALAGAALPGVPGVAAPAIQASAVLVPRVTVEAIARLPALVDGLSLGEGWQQLAQQATASVRRAVQQGLTLGEPPAAIVRRIVPPRGSTEPAAWRGGRAQATTFVRTSVTAVHNAAAAATYEAAGVDAVTEYALLAVRDSRTSTICAALDGQRFRFNDPRRKVPPFHPNCRTTIVPIPNYAALGLSEPTKSDPRTAALTFESFDEWFQRQPAWRQNTILGPTRGGWYRDGQLGLRELIDQDNRILTLEQLRARLVPAP